MIVVGIDGGGTKTHGLALDDQGSVIGTGAGGPSNYHSIGLQNALDVMEDVTRQALNGHTADIGIYCVGACDSALDEQRLTDGLAARNVARRLICYNDAFAPLRAGSRYQHGVAVICGSGFNACGIAPDRRRFKLYSLGGLTGDWGGGYSLGEAICGAVYRADDGRGQPTILTDMLLQAMNMPDLATLAFHITEKEVSSRQVAKLAPLAFDAALAGDKVACGIIIRLADEMATGALAMLRRLDMTDLETDVILSGSVASGRGPLLVDTIVERVAAECPRASVRLLDMPPVIGSVYLGFDALTLPVPDVDLRNLPIARLQQS